MNAKRWEQIKEIYVRALDLCGDEREGFLAGACACDADLRREIETLLAAHADAGTFLESSAVEVAAREIVADELIFPAPQLIGRELANYRIVSLLGRGGMGEVYLAEDKRLHRKVALKLSPTRFMNDAERARRFEREARTVSSLNHPNIVTIFDIGQDGGLWFMATEFIEGRTLRQVLDESKPLRMPEVFRIASQIADALQAAHDVGIIHRDIKPDNVMLRRDGYVKVLDFGLAKVAEKQTEVELTLSSVSSLTEAGLVMGTVNYMSPEQARGLNVDERTDIFSLGVVIYQMIASRLPFEGATASDVIASILNSEPPPLARYSPDAPEELEQVVAKALAKKQEERYQSVKDLTLDLKALAQEMELRAMRARGGRLGPESAKEGATRQNRPVSEPVRLWKLWGGLAIALVIGITAAWFGWRRTHRALPPVVNEFAPVRLTNHIAIDDSPAYSPDGKKIAFISNRDGMPSVYVMNADGGDVRKLVNDLPNCSGLAWSSDGTKLYFYSEGRAYVVNADGGNLTKLPYRFGSLSPDGKKIVFGKELILGSNQIREIFVDDVTGGNTIGLANNLLSSSDPFWSPDGKRLAFTCFHDSFEICAIDANGKNLVRLSNNRAWDSQPIWSPDGTRIAFYSSRNCKGNVMAIHVMNADGSNVMQLTECQTFGYGKSWSPDSRNLLYASDRDGNFEIYAINADPSHQTNVTRHLAEDREPVWSRDGKKIAFISNRDSKDSLFVMDAYGANPRKLVSNVTSRLSWSPDGRRIVFYAAWAGNNDVYVANADGSGVVQLTHNTADETEPVWAPDGTKILFTHSIDGKFQLYVMNADGSGLVRISNSPEHEWQHDWSPDGKQIVFARSRNRGYTRDIWMMNADGGNPRLIAASPGTDEFLFPRFSPDGQRIAFQRRVASPLQADIWVMNSDGSGQTRLTHRAGGWPTWSPDGKKIAFFARKREGNSEIYVMDVADK